MENENIENLDSQNEEAEVVPETTEEVPKEYGLPEDKPDEPENIEDIEELKKKNQELYEQLKKAKGFERDKKTGKWIIKEKPKEENVKGTSDITRTELYSLVKANVPDEDVNEVVIYARSHNIDITSALKMPEVKAILKVKDEYRKSEQVANMGSSRRNSPRITPEELIRQSERNILPEEKDIDSLAEARLEAKRKSRGLSQ
ncbi:MAG: hypothetical protein PHT54_03570 [Candidatus Nanoarchaeia archaeon]|nr:hypothetical protein [Candidatus Nanoarchaeia archaeon]